MKVRAVFIQQVDTHGGEVGAEDGDCRRCVDSNLFLRPIMADADCCQAPALGESLLQPVLRRQASVSQFSKRMTSLAVDAR